MKNKAFLEEINLENEIIKKALEKELKDYKAPEKLLEAMKYTLFSGGKRIRPILTLETAKSLGFDENKVLPLALACELIHNYSLIHDDLPLMDDDDLRRGKPSNHIVFGDAIALLAGDGLLNTAMEITLNHLPVDNLDYYLQGVKFLFSSAGIDGMIGGQTKDILLEEKEVTKKDIDYLINHKTADLITAAILCGAIPYLGIKNKRVNYLKDYAHSIGYAFQIVDDILDVEGDEEILGKPIGSDEKNHKATYVSLYGIDESKKRVQEFNKKAHQALEKLDLKTNFLADMADFICEREK